MDGAVREIRDLMVDPLVSERITVYKTLESTNKTAKELVLADNAPHGSVIIALNQTGAYGRREKPFYTYDGGVYISIVLRPKKFLPETAAIITTSAAVSVCNAVYAVSGKQCGVKWVNDILLGGKKICGILTESISGTDAAVLGIGINLTPFGDGVPREIADIAGTVFEDGEVFDKNIKNRFAANIIEGLLEDPERLTGTFSKSALAEYRARCGVFLGKEVRVIPNSGAEYRAAAVDIDERGRLIVRKPDGTSEHLSSGEISVKL